MTSQNDEWKVQAERNAEMLRREIESLNDGHWTHAGIGLRRRNFKEFFEHVRAIDEMFKELRPLTKQDRDQL